MTQRTTELSIEYNYAECRYAESHKYFIVMLRVTNSLYCYAECRYAQFHCAECHFAECHYAECHGAIFQTTNYFRPVCTILNIPPLPTLIRVKFTITTYELLTIAIKN